MTKNMGRLGSLVLSAFSISAIASSAYALTNQEAADLFTVGNAKSQEITTPEQMQVNMSGAADLSSVLDPITQIINVGKQVWAVIVSSKPVVNAQTSDVANAVPAANWQQLSGWSAPQTRAFDLPFKNGFGMTLVDFKYNVIYTYGGNLNNAGHYLSGVTLASTALKVDMGMRFDADVKVINVTNVGTTADPVSAMQIQLHWVVESISSHKEGTENYYIRGDGQFSQI
jgi:hypothetical protein